MQSEYRKQDGRLESRLRRMDAGDERQYMLNENYEVYEKLGAPLGAGTFHYHNFYEIIYVMEGEFSSMVEDRTYLLRKGDFLLINRNIMHKYHYVEKKHDSSKRIILWITSHMMEKLSEGGMNLADCFGERAAGICHFPNFYEEMLRGYLLKLAMGEETEALPGLRQVMDRGYLTLFFGYLNMLCSGGEYLSEGEELTSHPLVEQVSAYIDLHMEERITLEELALQVHMSKYHFLRKFKELTGVTVHVFLNHKRLIRACEAINEGRSITQAYQSAGFTDYSSFLRNFRQTYGVSPGKYRDFYSGF